MNRPALPTISRRSVRAWRSCAGSANKGALREGTRRRVATEPTAGLLKRSASGWDGSVNQAQVRGSIETGVVGSARVGCASTRRAGDGAACSAGPAVVSCIS
jgi:hypothetical protein